MLAYVPALLAVVTGLAQGMSTRLAASWSFYGTDIAQHMQLLKGVQGAGNLGTPSGGYPRGLHMLLALVSAPSVPSSEGHSLLDLDLRLVAGSTWLALGLLLACGASFTLRLSQHTGRSRAQGITAATVLGVALLMTNPFIATFVYMGAGASLVAVVVLWALPAAALAGVIGPGRSTQKLWSCAGISLALLANLWQALAAVPVAAMLSLMPGQVHEVGRAAKLIFRRRGVGLLAVAALLVVALVVGRPSVELLRAGGLHLAATPGTTPRPPWPVAVLSLLAMVWIAQRCGGPVRRLFLGGAVGLLATALALLVGSGHPFDITQYYVMKVAWFGVLYAAPATALACTAAALGISQLLRSRLGALGGAAAVARIASLAVIISFLVAFVLPLVVVRGAIALETVTDGYGGGQSARRYHLAVEYSTRFRPAITVPVGIGRGVLPDAQAAQIVSKLISFQTGQGLNYGRPTQVCSDVNAVAGDRPAVVLTSLQPAVIHEIMKDKGCGAVRVVELPGPPTRTFQRTVARH